jgi:hypothetical protein
MAGRFSDAPWQLLQSSTGAADDQIVIGIQEVPPGQAMEMGQIMPEFAKQRTGH